MRKYVNIICILDMSGSMGSIIESARNGFNNFLNDQKSDGKKKKMTLLFFDDNFYMPYENINIKKVKEVTRETYFANGGTALYDAIGFSIDNFIDNLATLPLEKRPEKTLFVILTDGEENQSSVYHRELIKSMVTEMREEYNAEFIYLGANQDACFTASSLGISSSNAYNYAATSSGIENAYVTMSSAVSYYASNDVKENLFQQ